MAFNASNFTKNTSKSAVEKLVDNVLSKVTSGLPMSAQLTTDSTAKTLFNIGASYESVEAFASRKTDSIISGAADEFFAIAGKAVNRASGAPITQLRRSSDESVNSYLENVNPTTKITSKRKRDEYEVLSVV
jgi:hypothetical protein